MLEITFNYVSRLITLQSLDELDSYDYTWDGLQTNITIIHYFHISQDWHTGLKA